MRFMHIGNVPKIQNFCFLALDKPFENSENEILFSYLGKSPLNPL